MQLKKMVFKGSFWRWVSYLGQVISHHTAAPLPVGDTEKRLRVPRRGWERAAAPSSQTDLFVFVSPEQGDRRARPMADVAWEKGKRTALWGTARRFKKIPFTGKTG